MITSTVRADFETYEGDPARMAYKDMFAMDDDNGIPFSNEARVNLTDAYQIRMAYAYWKSGKHEQTASFEVFFRTAPFGGQYVVLAGVDEVLRAINIYRFAESDFDYMRTALNIDDVEFFAYLRQLDVTKVEIYAQAEGSIVFPKTPLLQIVGPLILCQLLETMILNLLNFPSLIATNALRMRREAGKDKQLVEFGLRRAQGPDGAMSASRYSFVGGFDGTSNVRAGEIFGLPCFGTHAHAFVTTFSDEDLNDKIFNPVFPAENGETFKNRCISNRKLLFDKTGDLLGNISECNDGELASFITFAASYPTIFFALVDTFDTLCSGLPNYLAVAMTIQEFIPGQRTGLRLDSGDLAYLSKTIRHLVNESARIMDLPDLKNCYIFASNDINESVLKSLNEQKHEIDAFGIGTNLVTCQAQPALGLVYKMTSLNGAPKLKLSENVEKNSIPYRKALYRLYNAEGEALMDYVIRPEDPAPKAGDRVFTRHLTSVDKRCYVVPSKVEEILKLQLSGGRRSDERQKDYFTYLSQCRQRALDGIETLRKDHLRSTFPSVYKVSTSDEFFQEITSLRLSLTPIKTVR